ncbi:MAG: hypothetical protein NC340_02935 [Ruminococcus flavefaciens]|nr:hypothetical protein [Ruminococcus flavefaciens]MCM1229456.1 hypothetical protein [Ruminococcus flavefaciens]
MSDMKLTNEKMLTFIGQEKIGVFKAGEKLAEFGEKQNSANEALALNINDLIKRVCALEDKQLEHESAIRKDEEVIRKIATELSAFKKELDRVRLSDKLNSSAIERLNNAITLAEENNKK